MDCYRHRLHITSPQVTGSSPNRRRRTTWRPSFSYLFTHGNMCDTILHRNDGHELEIVRIKPKSKTRQYVTIKHRVPVHLIRISLEAFKLSLPKLYLFRSVNIKSMITTDVLCNSNVEWRSFTNPPCKLKLVG